LPAVKMESKDVLLVNNLEKIKLKKLLAKKRIPFKY
jgi:hypothetical protein